MKNNIKVTVEYTKPTIDKIEALFKQYEIAKQTAEATENYYTPLSEVAEERKLCAILEQLEPIKQRLKKIVSIGGYSEACTSYHELGNPHYYWFKIRYNEHRDEFKITWQGHNFDIETYRKHKDLFNGKYRNSDNILGNWDDWKMYEGLEYWCVDELDRLIAKQEIKAKNRLARFKNITR